MTITKRTLERWRKEALVVKDACETKDPTANPADRVLVRQATIDYCERILRLTQVLLDQHLMKERKS